MNDGPQNVWQFLLIVGTWIESHFTRFLGVVGGLLGILAAGGVLPDKWDKWCMIGIAALTYLRGQTISTRVNTANAIIAASNTPPAAPALSTGIPK